MRTKPSPRQLSGNQKECYYSNMCAYNEKSLYMKKKEYQLYHLFHRHSANVSSWMLQRLNVECWASGETCAKSSSQKTHKNIWKLQGSLFRSRKSFASREIFTKINLSLICEKIGLDIRRYKRLRRWKIIKKISPH